MNLRIISACFFIGSLFAPIAVYSGEMAKDAPSSKGATSSASTTKETTTKESPREFVEDALITSRIKADFIKDKQVDAANIKVDTTKGAVHLTGSAKNQAEIDKAVSIARNMKGVSAVKNDIKVQAK